MGWGLFKSIKRVFDYGPLRVSAGINRQCYTGPVPSRAYEVTGNIIRLSWMTNIVQIEPTLATD